MGSGAFRGATGLKGHRDGPVGAGEVPVGAGPGSRGAGPVWGGLGCSPVRRRVARRGHLCGVGRDAEASLRLRDGVHQSFIVC